MFGACTGRIPTHPVQANLAAPQASQVVTHMFDDQPCMTCACSHKDNLGQQSGYNLIAQATAPYHRGRRAGKQHKTVSSFHMYKLPTLQPTITVTHKLQRACPQAPLFRDAQTCCICPTSPSKEQQTSRTLTTARTTAWKTHTHLHVLKGRTHMLQPPSS